MNGPATRQLVAIDGVDGSGKTRLAEALAATLNAGGTPTLTVSVDDFRRPLDWTGAGKREADLYYDDYYDFPRLDGALAAFLEGRDGVEIPRFDSAHERLEGTRRLSFSRFPIAVVEGVFLLRSAVVATRAPLIYVATSLGEAHRRIRQRDVARGRPPAEVERRITVRYFPGQARYRAAFDPVGHAAAVIDNEQPRDPRLVRLETSRFPDPVGRALNTLFPNRADGSHAPA